MKGVSKAATSNTERLTRSTVWLKARWAAVAAGLMAMSSMAGAATTQPPEGAASKAQRTEVPPPTSAASHPSAGPTSFAPIVKKVSPSVVQVDTTVRSRGRSTSEAPWSVPPSLRRYFEEWFSPPGRAPRLDVPLRRGIASGVIVNEDGYILTNDHVVDGAEEVRVSLSDGRRFTAKVIGRDPQTDLAVLKVEASKLPALELADSDRVQVGDVVLAIGNPFGIGQTVTAGIVSALGRTTLGLDYEDLIQTDAAINPGNSGGALVDGEGRLIGINTAILSRTGGYQGIGFAIPSNLARFVMEQLIPTGKVTRGYLGVIVQELTPALAEQFKVKEPKGVLLSDVTANSPADKAGLKAGDVIVEFDGKAVTDTRQFKLQVARVQPGTTVPVKILRDGQAKNLQVKVGQLPSQPPRAAAPQPEPSDTETLKGVGVTDLDARTRRQFGIPPHIQGALVVEVDPSSASAKAGLKPGDVILEINRQRVHSAQDAVRLTQNPKTRTTLVRLWSQGQIRYLVVDETKSP